MRQQNQLVSAIRAHLGKFGIIIPNGIQNVNRLIEACKRAKLQVCARKSLNLFAYQLVDTQKRIADLTADVGADLSAKDAARRS